jgi:hypothetical protein
MKEIAMKTEKKQIETKFDRDLDPFADTRTFPRNWDLSDMPQLPESQADSPGSQADGQAMIDHGLEPGAIDEWHLSMDEWHLAMNEWHLAAAFEEHTAYKRRGWSAY